MDQYRSIYIKDPHFSFGFQNKIRKNYNSDIRSKIDYIINYCIDNNINDLIFTGDVFDNSNESRWSFKQYLMNKEIFDLFKVNNIRVHSIMGNHDMFHGFEGSTGTVYGELVSEGYISDLSTNPINITFGNNCNFILSGIPYSNDKNKILESLSHVNNINATLNGVVLHSNITSSEERVTDFTYQTLSEGNPNINMYVCGHFHNGIKTMNLGSKDKPKIFINNWNLTRVIRDYTVQMGEHTPEFEDVIITIGSDGVGLDIKTTTIQIPHIDYKQAFNPKVFELEKLRESDMFEFFEKIDFNDIKGEELTDIELIQKFDVGISPTQKIEDILALAYKYLDGGRYDRTW